MRKLYDQLLRKNPDEYISTVVLFVQDFNREYFHYYKYSELEELCRTDDEFKEMIFVSATIQTSILGENQMFCFVETKDYHELFASS